MKLRSKLLIILLAGIFLTGGTHALIQHFSIYPRFLDLEDREAKKDLQRCTRALQTEVEHLKALTHDWASWDDTCEYIQNGLQEYEESNLALETFVDAGLNALYFYNAQGVYLWGKSIDLETKQPFTIQVLTTGILQKGNPLFLDLASFIESTDISKTGLLETEHGLMMAASLPILTTENKGPALGTLIMGRIVTNELKTKLREQTQVPFDIQGADGQFKVTTPGSAEIIAIKPLDPSTLWASIILRDITGKPSIQVHANLSRDILAQGYATMRTARNAIILTGFILLGMLSWMLAVTIVKPITRLTGHVLITRKTGSYSGRCYGGRKDEIGTLEQEFDRLLETVSNQSIELERELGFRKEIARELEENLHKYKLLAENLKDVVASITPDGFIQYCSPAIKEFSGHDLEDVIGQHVFRFMPENRDRERLIDLVDEIAREKDSRSLEYLMRAKNGTVFPVESTAKPVMENGKLVALQCVFRDITQRRMVEEEKARLEAKLQQAHRMEALGTLAGGIAHNFNNVLFPIMGNTELAMMEVPQESMAYKNLQEVLVASERAKKLVMQILSFSESGKEDPKLIAIEDVLEETLGLIRASLPSTIVIREEIKSAGSLVYADPVELQTVIMNICSNASYAMKELGGILELTLVEQDISGFDLDASRKIKPGRYVKITVSDNGPGMEAGVMERIFEPYFTTKPVGEGPGMGLSEAHALISKYGGDITVYTELGMGTSFYIYLPVMVEANDKPVLSDIPRGTEKVLLVDDEEPVLNMTQQMLENLGYHVTATNNSTEALELFEAAPYSFDLVLTDMTMPYVTGDSLANRVLSMRPDIPIILCTGFTERLSREQARDIGISAYVSKPVVMAQIAGIIRGVLDKSES